MTGHVCSDSHKKESKGRVGNPRLPRLDLLPSSISLIDLQDRIPMVALAGRWVAAPGLSARPNFNRNTDDAIDLCDVLSSFASQAKARASGTETFDMAPGRRRRPHF